MLVLATPSAASMKRQLVMSSAPASTALRARCWSKRSRSVVYPVKGNSYLLSLGSTSLMPSISLRLSSEGTSKSSSASVRLGNIPCISSTEGTSSPQRTGTPTSGRCSIMVTLRPLCAA